ncbi:hypothetical protein MMC15_008023 [Xylographa vitiligo]|nr:hypothetical protein [Xylographa vitiligo]
MSSPTPAPKRRKTSALFKPFKSPLKHPLPAPPPVPGAAIANETHHPSPLSTITNSSTAPPATLDDPALSKPHPTASPTPKPTSTSTTSTSLPPLQTHHTTLTHTHTRLLSALDTHTQALKIEASAQDAELARLTALWRLAARQAAEEIFAGVRDRVNRMGGVGAWREREREGRERWGGGGGGGWDDGGEERQGGGDEGEGEEEEEGVEERREREGGEESDRLEERERREWGERDDDVSCCLGFPCAGFHGRCYVWREVLLTNGARQGFTMDMMLRSLNIELGIIGYDKEMQRWID